MKDLYKILGVKETASEEEIRERWVELMRRLHPDHIGARGSDERRIKEVNEAYEVLKYSASRARYDLSRVYERKKKIVSFRRAAFRKSYLLLFPILLGLIYLSVHESQPPSTPKQVEKPATGPMKKPEPVPPEEENLRFKEWRSFQKPYLFMGTGEASPQEAGKQPPKGKAGEAPRKVTKETSVKGTTGDSRETSRESEENRSLSSSLQVPSNPVKDEQSEPRGGAEEKRDSTVLQKEKNGASTQRQGDGNTPRPANNALAKLDEVEKFFEDYLSYYTQRDIRGFLGFFSSRAIQNRKQNIDEIRRTYARFFDQSESLLYQLKHPVIEILPNHVQVKASYEIRQVLKTGDTHLWKGNVEWALIRENGELKISSIQYQNDRSP